MTKAKLKVVNADITNGGKAVFDASQPYIVSITAEGASDLIFHRWNCESVEAKAAAAKNSKAKKEDDIESYVWRNQDGELCIPGEYFRQSIIHAAKFKQDPRSPRKSAMDLFKAGVISLTDLASLGATVWNKLDKRRVMVQRAGINRTRPAMNAGWTVDVQFQILTPEYIDPITFQDVLSTAGRLVGVGDFRPTYGRFFVSRYAVSN